MPTWEEYRQRGVVVHFPTPYEAYQFGTCIPSMACVLQDMYHPGAIVHQMQVVLGGTLMGGKLPHGQLGVAPKVVEPNFMSLWSRRYREEPAPAKGRAGRAQGEADSGRGSDPSQLRRQRVVGMGTADLFSLFRKAPHRLLR